MLAEGAVARLLITTCACCPLRHTLSPRAVRSSLVGLTLYNQAAILYSTSQHNQGSEEATEVNCAEEVHHQQQDLQHALFVRQLQRRCSSKSMLNCVKIHDHMC